MYKVPVVRKPGDGREPFGSRIFHGCDLGFKCIESIWIMCTRIGTMRTCSAQNLLENGCVCGKDADFLVQEPSPYSHAVTELPVGVYGTSAMFTECMASICESSTAPRVLPGGCHWKVHGPKGPNPSKGPPLEAAWTERSAYMGTST